MAKLRLGERIQRLRELRCLTQETLAGRVGISEPALSRIENSKQRVHVELLQRIARELGVTVAEMLGEAESTRRAG